MNDGMTSILIEEEQKRKAMMGVTPIEEKPEMYETVELKEETIPVSVRLKETLIATTAMLLFKKGYMPKNKRYIIEKALTDLIETEGVEMMSVEESKALITKWEL